MPRRRRNYKRNNKQLSKLPKPNKYKENNFYPMYMKSMSMLGSGAKATAALAMAYKAIKAVNPEKKELRTSIGGTPGTTATITPINVSQQGTTDQTRVGDSIKMVDIQYRQLFTVNASSTAEIVRDILLIDKQPTGS